MKIANRRQMMKIDETLLKTYSIEQLVDKASETLVKYFDDDSCVYVVCGGGNNGADGFSLALKLHHLGKKVKVTSLSKPRSRACEYYLNQCAEKNLLMDCANFLHQMKEADVLVDAIFGFGCTHNPEGIFKDVIHGFNKSNKKIISIDVPSGLDCDRGEAYENCIQATMTITFFAMKRGFLNPSSSIYTGKVYIENLDVEMDHLEFCESYVLSKLPHKKYDGYKHTYGRAFLICGSEKYHGAALLSSKACVYTGCGITYLHSPSDILQQVSLTTPECVLSYDLKPLNDCQAILIGCGLENQESLLEKILKETTQPLVIDASSLHDLANHLEWLENHHRKIILTPHLGEFKHLVVEVEDVTTAAIEFAKKYQVIIVLKGPHTLITNGDMSFHNMSGSPAMAIGGSGDVLAGMIVSLLAQGYDAIESACMGTYLHGKCGEKLAESDYTALPSRMIELIPSIMKEYEE